MIPGTSPPDPQHSEPLSCICGLVGGWVGGLVGCVCTHACMCPRGCVVDWFRCAHVYKNNDIYIYIYIYIQIYMYMYIYIQM